MNIPAPAGRVPYRVEPVWNIEPHQIENFVLIVYVNMSTKTVLAVINAG